MNSYLSSVLFYSQLVNHCRNHLWLNSACGESNTHGQTLMEQTLMEQTLMASTFVKTKQKSNTKTESFVLVIKTDL